ncbi:hypothetical protein GCM10027592_59390 [Spirosoma flavus]
MNHNTGNYNKVKDLAYSYQNQRLVKYYDEDYPISEKSTLFNYNNDGDLISVTVQKNETLIHTDKYSYDTQQKDYHPHNPKFSFFGEGIDEGTELMFLPVFGTFNKHLIKNISRTQNAPYKVLFNYAYKYDVNSDGRVTKRERWNQTTNQLIETEQYQYKVESLITMP